MRRKLWIWLALVALVASACAGDSGDDADADVVVGEDDAPRELDEPDPGPDPAAQLTAALSDAGSVTSYRLETYQGQTLEVPGIGIRDIRPLDRSVPVSVAIIDGDRLYVEIDLASAFGDAAPVDELELRMWQTADELIVDTRSYQQLVDLDPSGALGPFRPGVSRVDLAAVEAGGDDLVQAITGSGSPALGDFTAALIESLDGVEVLEDGRVFRGSAVYGSLIEAQGNDVESVARGLAGGLALNLGVDVDALTELYVDLYNNAPTEIVVRLEDDGVLAEIQENADLSALYTNMGDFIAGIDPTADAADTDVVAALFDDAVFKTELLQVVDLDPTPMPEVPIELEDRTQEWVDFLLASGFGG